MGNGARRNVRITKSVINQYIVKKNCLFEKKTTVNGDGCINNGK